MSALDDALTDEERAALIDPRVIDGVDAVQRQLRELTAEVVTTLDVMRGDPRRGLDLAAATPRRIFDLTDREARHLLLAALEQLAAYVIRDRSTTDADRYAAQVEAEEIEH